MKWKTKEGKILDITEMTDNHLLNAIAYTKRKRPDFEFEADGAFEYGYNLTASNMLYFAEQYDKVLKKLITEARKRGIQLSKEEGKC